ncbi:HAD hydrolase family protein [Clostridium sp.]|uniref:HAD hydrolase family protein n=1 Tax=Clostridium sp. TaxID=1506 RepID=UPI003216CEB7
MLPCILNRKECNKNSIKPEECIAVCDGSTDIPIFEFCGKSVAINSSPKVQKSVMLIKGE